MKQFISQIRNIGIYPDLTADEVVKVRLINTLFLMIISVCLVFTLIAIADQNLGFTGIILGAILLQIVGLYLVARRHYKKIHLYVIGELSILFFVYNVFLIEDMGSKFVLLMIVYLVYVFFESNKVRFTLVPIILGLYFLSSYLQSFIPPSYVLIVPTYFFIKELLFIFYVIWIGYLINHYHDDVVREKVKQKNLIEELNEKNQKVKEIATELERFNHIASHDLKSPLRNIISFLGLTKMKLKRNRLEEVPEQLKYVENASEQMDILVNDIAEFSKIKTELTEAVEIDLPVLINNVVAKLQPAFPEQQVQVFYNEFPTIWANETEMTMVFQHLIKNAWQYNTSEEPTIRITYSASDKHFFLKFQDNGIGVKEEYQAQIFEYFKRLHTYEAYQGSGLGLGIVNKIIQKLGGNIHLESTKNYGSVFILELPISILANVSTNKA